jgi:hypothetical protein
LSRLSLEPCGLELLAIRPCLISISLEMERERGVVVRVLDPGPEPGLGPPDDPVGRLRYPEPMLMPAPISGPVSCCFRPRS